MGEALGDVTKDMAVEEVANKKATMMKEDQAVIYGAKEKVEDAEVKDDGLPVRLATWNTEEDERPEDLQEGRARGEAAWVGRGPPRTALLMGKQRPFCDGGGLCVPGRRPPKIS